MSYEILWTPVSVKHIEYWKKKDKKKIDKIKSLCKSMLKDPTKGIGKPERLKFFRENIWSRRIDQENRLVYEIKKKEIYILQARYHY